MRRASRPIHRRSGNLFLFALALTVVLGCACAQTSAPDIYGLWRTQTDDGRVVLLELRSDGTYTRTATLEGTHFLSRGEWSVVGNKLRFVEKQELIGPRATDSHAIVETPFQVQGGTLVLKPGTEFEERYVLVQ
jgi:hypothetical protein